MGRTPPGIAEHEARYRGLLRALSVPKLSIAVHRYDAGFDDYTFDRIPIPRQPITTTDNNLETKNESSGDSGSLEEENGGRRGIEASGLLEEEGKEMAQFTATNDRGPLHRVTRTCITKYHPATERNITVRLGEGELSAGHIGGGDTIQFDWKGAINELLREMFMRRFAEEAVRKFSLIDPQQPYNTCQKLIEKNSIPYREQIRTWRCTIQMSRRVAGLQHRAKKSTSTTSGRSCEIQTKFNYFSQKFHKQPTPSGPVIEQLGIYKLASEQELVVPQLDVFKRWVAQQQPQYIREAGE
ncbi:hypothetical protein B0H63DRAFT_534487 [Podospora didyma]|uniref:Uncharacterized protein n=1 Tax=Podospora didyma TaxID=330526 RepID=A0AAE0N318_9PEZI|nr:hypothetical protein B0H63DRAFT_534487 [Podospora didyma]